MRDPHVGAQVSKHPRDKREVIVLHHGADRDRLAGRPGVGSQRLGERRVVRPEGLPFRPEAGPKNGWFGVS